MSAAESPYRRAETLAEELGRPREALAAVEQALAGDPQNARLLVLRAWIYVKLDEPGHALEAAQAAIECDPDSEWAHRIMSIAHRRRGDYRKAVRTGREAVRLAPDMPYPHAVLGQALSMRLWTWREGSREIARALELAPHDTAVLRCAGDAAVSRRRPTLAVRYYREVLAIDPQDAETVNNLARAQGRRFRFRHAMLGYADAVSMKPTLEVSYRNIGAAVYRLMLITYPVVLVCALFAADVTPRIPLILPFVGFAAYEVRGNVRRLHSQVWPVVKRRGIRFRVLTIGALVAAGSMLVVPFLPAPAATSTARTIARLDVYPTAMLFVGYVIFKLRAVFG